jgi:hypothetical protein
MSLPEGLQRASVIACCANPLPGNIVSQYGKRIIRISDHQVVKWGPDVTKAEFENQRIAYELVDCRIARIPRVYDFFSDERGWGYIVMELIEGKVIDPLNDVSAIQRVARVLNHFATLRYNLPGLFMEALVAAYYSLKLKTWFSPVLTGWRSGSIAGFFRTTRPLIYKAVNSCSVIWI